MPIVTPHQKHGHTLWTKYCVVRATADGTSSYHTRSNAIRHTEEGYDVFFRHLVAVFGFITSRRPSSSVC